MITLTSEIVRLNGQMVARVTVEYSKEKPPFIDRVSLDSERSRKRFASRAAALSGESAEVVEEALLKLAVEQAHQPVSAPGKASATPPKLTDEDSLKRPRAAEKDCERGSTLETDEEGLIALGCRDPETNKLVLSPKRTLPTAQAYVHEFYTRPEGRTLQTYAGLSMVWQNNRYVVVEDAALKNSLQPWLHQALRYIFDKRGGNMLLVPFESNPATVNAALETIQNHTLLPVTITPPVWLDGTPGLPHPKEILSCKTLNLHIPSGEILAPTPALFTTSALNFDYDREAMTPVFWLGFLKQLFGDDTESIELLQDCFGYYLTPDTSQQKILVDRGSQTKRQRNHRTRLEGVNRARQRRGPDHVQLGGSIRASALDRQEPGHRQRRSVQWAGHSDSDRAAPQHLR